MSLGLSQAINGQGKLRERKGEAGDKAESRQLAFT